MASISTYTPLISYTLSSGATSMTVTNIPTTYTDLRIVVNSLAYYASSGTFLTGALQVGSSNTIDTGSNYNSVYMYADGSTKGSAVQSGTDIRYSLDVMAASTDTGARSNNFIDIMGYSSANAFKSMIIRTNTVQTATATNMMRQAVAQWRNSTAAINTIKITNIDGTNFYAGSTITIYGISNNLTGAKATGGTISSDTDYIYHTFASTGVFTPSQSLTCDYLVLAGGGGAGANRGGGGGGGGMRCTVTATGGGGALESPLSVTATPYTITVGAGGPGGTYGTNNAGTVGGNSTFSTITSTGGGGGGGGISGTGGNGGSGGGAGWDGSGGYSAGSASPSGQGYAGGNSVAGVDASSGGGGGGGGAGAVGTAATNAGLGTAGNGGNGVATSVSGVLTYYGGGGGGDGRTIGGTGGLGGGGKGANQTTTAHTATNGVASLGGGGGASDTSSSQASNGGSGIVIIRYAR